MEKAWFSNKVYIKRKSICNISNRLILKDNLIGWLRVMGTGNGDVVQVWHVQIKLKLKKG